MTREEAIEILRDTPIDIRSTREDDIHTLYATAQNLAIEALSADTVSRETYHNLVTASNDIDRALREYQDKDENGELVSVVRCKDCRHYKKINPRAKSGMCYKDIVASAWNDDGFCSRAERREL